MGILAGMFTPEQLAAAAKVIQAMNASASGSETKKRQNPPGHHYPLRTMNPLTLGGREQEEEQEEPTPEDKGDPGAKQRKILRKPLKNNTWNRVPNQQIATPSTPKGVQVAPRGSPFTAHILSEPLEKLK